MGKMKKFLRYVFCICVCVTMVASLAACGSDDDFEDSQKKNREELDRLVEQANENLKNNKDDSDKKDSDDSGKDYKTMKEYLNSDEVQNEIKDQVEAYKSQGITLELEADDSTLTYKYTYNVAMQPSDELTAAFDTEVAKLEDTMKDLVDQLSKLVEAKNISIIFRYYSSDGTELYSCEFK